MRKYRSGVLGEKVRRGKNHPLRVRLKTGWPRWGKRLLRGLEVTAVLAAFLGVIAFFQDLKDRQEARINAAWQLVTTPAPGNSGKGPALEYLNSQDEWFYGIDGGCWRWCPAWTRSVLFSLLPIKQQISLRGINLSEERHAGIVALTFVDLSGADLTGADLSGADLSNTDLSGAFLWLADLSGADLSDADLSGAYLMVADLSGTKLMEADLSGANLSDADLNGAELSKADLSEADLMEADLSEAKLMEADLSGANLMEADLSGANLENADLGGANLPEADLSGANLENADLGGAFLVDAKLSKANLENADLSGASLWLADLSGAYLENADLSGVYLWQADLSGANVTQLSGLTHDMPPDGISCEESFYYELTADDGKEVGGIPSDFPCKPYGRKEPDPDDPELIRVYLRCPEGATDCVPADAADTTDTTPEVGAEAE